MSRTDVSGQWHKIYTFVPESIMILNFISVISVHNCVQPNHNFFGSCFALFQASCSKLVHNISQTKLSKNLRNIEYRFCFHVMHSCSSRVGLFQLLSSDAVSKDSSKLESFSKCFRFSKTRLFDCVSDSHLAAKQSQNLKNSINVFPLSSFLAREEF